MAISDVLYQGWSKVHKASLVNKATAAFKARDYKTVQHIRESTGVIPPEAVVHADFNLYLQSPGTITRCVIPAMESTAIRPTSTACEEAAKHFLESDLRKYELQGLQDILSLGVPFEMKEEHVEAAFARLLYHRNFEQLNEWTKVLGSMSEKVFQQACAAYIREGWSDDVETLIKTAGLMGDSSSIHQARQRAQELKVKGEHDRELFNSLSIPTWFCQQHQEYYKDSTGIDTYDNSTIHVPIFQKVVRESNFKIFDFFEGNSILGINSIGAAFLYLIRQPDNEDEGILRASLNNTYRERTLGERLGWTRFAAAGRYEDMEKVMHTFEEHPKSIRTFLQTVCHWEQKPTEANLVERMEYLFLHDEKKGKRYYHFCPDVWS